MDRRFRSIWAADFEFRALDGEPPEVVCLVARNLVTGQEIRLWGEELARPLPPYDIGPDSLFIAYYASAEMGCHLSLGWPMPVNVLDLYAEFRLLTNGKVLSCGNGLLGALAHFGLDGIDALEKQEMRDMVLRGGEYSPEEQEAILDYCASDVSALERLFPMLAPSLMESPQLEQALLRGGYTKAVAWMERLGIPIDVGMLADLRCHFEALKDRLIAEVDAGYGVYDGRSFRQKQFADYLVRQGIPWPTTATGRLCLDDDTFSEQCKSHPQLRPLKDLRHILGQLRLSELPVGRDGRNRCLLSMFRATTGRNQPSNAKFVFGLPAWLRGLIQPRPGNGLAYVDWSQQEFGIAAALSGDPRMQEAYGSGDPYLTFAKQAGAVPWGASKASHPKERDLYKACALAVQYGMGAESLAKRIGQPTVYAEELLKAHRRTYEVFWHWSDAVVDHAMLNRKLWTTFGWMVHVQGKPNPRSLRNFPMQANGAEMLRLACIYGIQAGIRVIAPVHDAVLIEAPLDELEAATAIMQEAMKQASRVVLAGFELRSDAKLVRAPDRYEDERGATMWAMVMRLLDELRQEACHVQPA